MKRHILSSVVLGLLAWPLAAALRADDAAQQAEVLRQRDAILRKMAEIRIPEIDFRQANINDVISFLQEASFNFDPKKRGVNMIFNPRWPRTAGASPAEREGEEPVSLITLHSKDMSLLEALNVITQTANLEYRIEGSVVMIRPAAKPAAASEGETATKSTATEHTPPTLTTPRLKRPASHSR